MNTQFNSFFLFIIFISALSFNSNAQHSIDISTAVYDEINANRAFKSLASFNLKGKVKSIVEVTTLSDDSNYYEFNEKGFLLLNACNSKNTTQFKSATTYSFENNQLKKIRIETAANKRTQEKLFDAAGHLVRVVNDWIDYDEKFHQEGFYTYGNTYNDLTITYRYKNQSDSWDLILKENYAFTFGEENRLIKVRHTSIHSETTYGSTTTLGYDSISGKLIAVTLRDDCAGSNSCLDLFLSMKYDKGNIIYESMSDHTIRNALWSYGYTNISKYNTHNDVIENYRNENNANGFSVNAKSVPADYEKRKTVYSYDYDANGNWIKKYTVEKNVRKLLTQRTITYFD